LALHLAYAKPFISFAQHLIFHLNFMDFPKTQAVKVSPFPGLKSHVGKYSIPWKIPITKIGNPGHQERELLQTGLLPRTGGRVWELEPLRSRCVVLMFYGSSCFQLTLGEKDCVES